MKNTGCVNVLAGVGEPEAVGRPAGETAVVSVCYNAYESGNASAAHGYASGQSAG
jgi:hypothetical protein